MVFYFAIFFPLSLHFCPVLRAGTDFDTSNIRVSQKKKGVLLNLKDLSNALYVKSFDHFLKNAGKTVKKWFLVFAWLKVDRIL